MRAREASKQRAVAYHEAGHAVASWHYGRRFKHVTIEVDGDSLGHVSYIRPLYYSTGVVSDRARLGLESEIIASFAGQIAEAKFREQRPRYGFHSDNQSAVDLAFHVCGSNETVNAYLKYCWCASTDIVNWRWREIIALADALLKTPTLKYSDALEVISPGSAALRASLEMKRK